MGPDGQSCGSNALLSEEGWIILVLNSGVTWKEEALSKVPSLGGTAEPPQSPSETSCHMATYQDPFLVPDSSRSITFQLLCHGGAPPLNRVSPNMPRRRAYPLCPFGTDFYQCSEKPRILAAPPCIRPSPCTSTTMLLASWTYTLST